MANIETKISVPESSYNAAKNLIAEVEKVVVGKHNEVVLLVTAMLSGGHVLIEDVPGTGKTTLAAALARSAGLDFNRAQFTPDVMASDITGFNVYNRQNISNIYWGYDSHKLGAKKVLKGVCLLPILPSISYTLKL